MGEVQVTERPPPVASDVLVAKALRTGTVDVPDISVRERTRHASIEIVLDPIPPGERVHVDVLISYDAGRRWEPFASIMLDETFDTSEPAEIGAVWGSPIIGDDIRLRAKVRMGRVSMPISVEAKRYE